ncbi:30S ribosomal protein S14 [Candidatus Bathyarchaeota archaeon]|nr:30S ribosomal protein S14 [Candidatus Bathyarchaeota archaeon]
MPKKKVGAGNLRCKRCGTFRAIIRTYGLQICRRCFREVSEELNFRKYN